MTAIHDQPLSSGAGTGDGDVKSQHGHEQLQALKRLVSRIWVLSPIRLWLLSIALHKRGHWVLAFWIKQLNSFVYHNSLSPMATVSPDLQLGHNSLGIVVTGNTTIGKRVKIWQNVTLSAGRPGRASAATFNGNGASAHTAMPARSRIIVEDGVTIGANAVVIAPRGATLRLGRGARVGAGTVVNRDVPAGRTIVGQAARLLDGDTLAGAGDANLSEGERPD
jgi:serine O-acetyltransferase